MPLKQARAIGRKGGREETKVRDATSRKRNTLPGDLKQTNLLISRSTRKHSWKMEKGNKEWEISKGLAVTQERKYSRGTRQKGTRAYLGRDRGEPKMLNRRGPKRLVSPLITLGRNYRTDLNVKRREEGYLYAPMHASVNKTRCALQGGKIGGGQAVLAKETILQRLQISPCGVETQFDVIERRRLHWEIRKTDGGKKRKQGP